MIAPKSPSTSFDAEALALLIKIERGQVIVEIWLEDQCIYKPPSIHLNHLYALFALTRSSPSPERIGGFFSSAFGNSADRLAKVSVAASACAAVPSNIRAWFRAESLGDSVSGANLQLSGGAAIVSGGRVGQGIRFDGIDDMARFDNTNAAPPTVGDRAIEFWFKPTVSIAQGEALSHFLVSRGAHSIGTANAGAFIELIGSTPRTTSSVANFNAGVWQHLAINSNANATAIYLNGALVGRCTNCVPALFSDAGEMKFGWDGVTRPQSGFGFNGIMDEISIYGKLLTDSEILSIYRAGGVGKCASQVSNGRWETLLPLIYRDTVGGGSALLIDGDEIYAGWGNSSAWANPPGIPVGIAKWTGSEWVSLGNGPNRGVNGQVFAIAKRNSDLFVAGEFSLAGGVPANNIARWDGANWHALGSGIGGRVHGLVFFENQLIAVGNFSTAGGLPVVRVARWDGSSWSSFGDVGNNYFDSIVSAIVVHNGELYVGGRFTQAGPRYVPRVARWNAATSQWVRLEDGTSNLNGDVYAMVSLGGELYVGGNLGLASGAISLNNVAKWNGVSWSGLGNGVSHDAGGQTDVRALATDGQALYAGGAFNMAGGVPARGVARWNGTEWRSLGVGAANGVTGWVRALSFSNKGLVVTGDFGSAGGRVPGRFARWSPLDPGSPTTTRITSISPSPAPTSTMVTVRFSVTGSADPQGEVQVVTAWGATCRAAVAQGLCTLITATPGQLSVQAIYGGDSANQTSISEEFSMTVF